ncbi:nucleoside-diphosphate-sugar epimerase [Arthrobacter sp. AG258]|nr:nucleoside-diphosphate-sugar epimerase [Arthrobacter sp. AG258]
MVDRSRQDFSVEGAAFAAANLLDPESFEGVCAGADALVHLAGYPAPTPAAPWQSFELNVMTSFNALAVAARLRIPRSVHASSASALGMAWAEETQMPRYVPIDDNHPLTPAEHYGLSKCFTELSAQSFVRETHQSAIVLRFPRVMTTADLEATVPLVAENPADRTSMRDLWSYIHLDDIGSSFADAVESPLEGFGRATVVAPDTLSRTPTSVLLSEHYPEVPVVRPIIGRAPAWDLESARSVLGRVPRLSWTGLPSFTSANDHTRSFS